MCCSWELSPLWRVWPVSLKYTSLLCEPASKGVCYFEMYMRLLYLIICPPHYRTLYFINIAAICDSYCYYSICQIVINQLRHYSNLFFHRPALAVVLVYWSLLCCEHDISVFYIYIKVLSTATAVVGTEVLITQQATSVTGKWSSVRNWAPGLFFCFFPCRSVVEVIQWLRCDCSSVGLCFILDFRHSLKTWIVWELLAKGSLPMQFPVDNRIYKFVWHYSLTYCMFNFGNAVLVTKIVKTV